jgi:hypothetical protein
MIHFTVQATWRVDEALLVARSLFHRYPFLHALLFIIHYFALPSGIPFSVPPPCLRLLSSSLTITASHNRTSSPPQCPPLAATAFSSRPHAPRVQETQNIDSASSMTWTDCGWAAVASYPKAPIPADLPWTRSTRCVR